MYKIIVDNYPNMLSSKNLSDTAPDKLAAEASLVTTRIPVKYSLTVTPKADDGAQNGTVVRIDSTKSEHSSNGHFQHHGYVASIKHRKVSTNQDQTILNAHKFKKTTASCPDVRIKNHYKQLDILEEKEEEEKPEKWYHNCIDVFGDIIDFSMFLQLHFFLVSIATIIMCIWFAVPFVYLADHMAVLGYSDTQVSLTISVIGITNVLGMVIIGFLGTKMKVATLYAACLFLSGISCAVMMLFSYNFIILIISSGAFGLFYASQHSLTPAIVAQLVPLEKFSMAYGLSLLCQGIGKLTGPPLAGYLFDLTQSYSQSFYQAAVWIFLSGILIGVIPYTKERKLCGR